MSAGAVIGELDTHELSTRDIISVPRSRRLFLLGGSVAPGGAKDWIRGSRIVDVTRSKVWFEGVRARIVRNGAIRVSRGARGGASLSLASEYDVSTLSSSSR